MKKGLVLFCMVMGALACTSQYQSISVEDFEAMAQRSGVTVVDVRTPKEYAEGHIAGAVNKDWKSERFAEEIGAYGTDERIVVYCARGVRSQKAAEMMSGMGFTQVFNLIGGFEVWKNAGKPIVKSVEYKEVKSHK